MIDPLGTAVQDFLFSNNDSVIEIESNLTENEEIPVYYLFRSIDQMPAKEQHALSMAKGRILDVGAGSGAHALALQNLNKKVVAIDISEKCCQAMKQQGVQHVLHQDFFTYTDADKFDTILFLMNGFGIAGKLDNLENFLQQCKSLLKPGGIVIGESADILYLFEEEDGSVNIDLNSNYYGEMEYRMTYKKQEGNWFPWLYVSSDILSDVAEKVGFKTIDLFDGGDSDYMICLQIL